MNSLTGYQQIQRVVSVLEESFHDFHNNYPLGIRTTKSEQQIIEHLYRETKGFQQGLLTQQIALSSHLDVATNVVSNALSLISAAGAGQILLNSRGLAILPIHPMSTFTYQDIEINTYITCVNDTDELELKSVRKVRHLAEVPADNRSRKDYVTMVRELMNGHSQIIFDASHLAIFLGYTTTQAHYWLHSVGHFTDIFVYNLRHKILLSKTELIPGDEISSAIYYSAQKQTEQKAPKTTVVTRSLDELFTRSTKTEYLVFSKINEITSSGKTVLLFKQTGMARHFDVSLPVLQKALRGQGVFQLPFLVESTRSGSIVRSTGCSEGLDIGLNQMPSPVKLISYDGLEEVEPLDGEEYMAIPKDTVQDVMVKLSDMAEEWVFAAVSVRDLLKMVKLTDYKLRYILKKLTTSDDLWLYRISGHLIVAKHRLQVSGLSEEGRLYKHGRG